MVTVKELDKIFRTVRKKYKEEEVYDYCVGDTFACYSDYHGSSIDWSDDNEELDEKRLIRFLIKEHLDMQSESIKEHGAVAMMRESFENYKEEVEKEFIKLEE